MPVPLRETCEAIPSLRDACPAEIPLSNERDFRFQAFRQGRHWTFTAEAGAGPHPQPMKNRPPGYVHVVLQAGDLSDAFETFTYSTSTTVPAKDGLMRSAERERLGALGRLGETPEGLFLGTRSLVGMKGDLILAPSFTFSDTIHADHVIFLWRAHGKDFALSLHAWEPFTESVATLESLVASIPTMDA